MKANTHFWSYLAHVRIRVRNVSDKSCREICSVTFVFFENRAVYEIMWKKYCRTEQATDSNTAHAYCVLDT